MDSEETWFGGALRRPSLRGYIYLGLSIILILWVILFLQGDIRLRLILAALIAVAAFGAVFFNWGSVLFWNGYKPFVFYLVAAGQQDSQVKEALSLFDDPGIKISIVELPREESIRFFLHRIGIFKKDMSSMASSGKIVPNNLVRSYEECNKLLVPVKENKGHVLVISALFDTSKISQQNASMIVRKAKEIAFI